MQTFAEQRHPITGAHSPHGATRLLRAARPDALSSDASHDALEEEASRVAGQLTIGSTSSGDGAQRLTTGGADVRAAEAYTRTSSSGHAIEPSTRQSLERGLGHDFGEVRVHADTRAGDSARGLGALAYTFGRDIVFGTGQYAPGTPAGRRLLAHELVHVVQQRRGGAALQRQPAPAVQQGTDADRREFVEGTVRFLNASARHYGDPLTPVDAALFERVINSWYVMVNDRETMIDANLGGDAGLKADLHAAYGSAIQALIARAATVFGQPEAELFRRNSGRIPMWAWPTPHHLEPGISTPIQQGRTVDVLTQDVRFAASGFDVAIASDTADPALGASAETRIAINWVLPGYQFTGPAGQRRITAVNPPAAPTARIQTFYGPNVTAASRSGYGRGTTPEDVAGGRVTPRSTSLGFHEGSHGLAFVQFLEANPAPRFAGAVGMTENQFLAARNNWETALRAYLARIKAFSEREVDCVGTTIDQFHRGGGAGGANVRIVCGP